MDFSGKFEEKSRKLPDILRNFPKKKRKSCRNLEKKLPDFFYRFKFYFNVKRSVLTRVSEKLNLTRVKLKKKNFLVKLYQERIKKWIHCKKGKIFFFNFDSSQLWSDSSQILQLELTRVRKKFKKTFLSPENDSLKLSHTKKTF